MATSIVLRRSPEVAKPKVNISRRNSTGKAVSLNNGDNVLPNYLRASTGSCHDLCKYGRNRAIAVKSKRPSGKGPIEKEPKTQQVETEVGRERKKTSIILRKPEPTIVTKQESLVKPVSKKTPVHRVILEENKKTPVIKPRISVDLKTSSCVKPKKQEVPSSSGKAKVYLKRVPLKPKEENPPLQLTPKPKSSSREISRGLANSRVALKRTSATPRALLRPKPSLKVPVSPRVSLSKVTCPNSQKMRTLKNDCKTKDVEKPVKLEASQMQDEEVQEKTLYVVETKMTESPSLSLLSIPNSPSSLSGEEETDEESEYSETEVGDDSLCDPSEHLITKESDETVEAEEYKGIQKKSLRVSTEAASDHQSHAVTLHFRRGKVVEPQNDNSGPRRLKFRRGRILGDNQNTKSSSRRSFKLRGVDGDKNAEKPDSEKVVLRHQDLVQGKKDESGLYNNVIEETANKLAETRKSKVKALVGAFETVISLQEKKP